VTVADPCGYGGATGCFRYSWTHLEYRMSKLPQTGQLWCWTSKVVSQAKQTYAVSPDPARPDTSFALSKTPITTTVTLTWWTNKKGDDCLRHFFALLSCGFPTRLAIVLAVDGDATGPVRVAEFLWSSQCIDLRTGDVNSTVGRRRRHRPRLAPPGGRSSPRR